MDAKQFYTKYINTPSVQFRYNGKDKHALMYEIMDKYAEHKSKNL